MDGAEYSACEVLLEETFSACDGLLLRLLVGVAGKKDSEWRQMM